MCIAALLAGSPETKAERYRSEVGARLIAQGIAELTKLRQAWS